MRASPLGLTKSVYNSKTSADTLFKPISNFGRQDASQIQRSDDRCSQMDRLVLLYFH